LSRNGFVSLLHVLSAVSTGGFSPLDNSLAGMPTRAAAIAVMLVSFLSAISLTLYWKAFHAGWQTGWRNLAYDVELRSLILACLLVGSLLGILGWLHGNHAPWYQGFMLGISAQTTTGFSTQNIATLDSASKLVMMVAMLIGGSVGSSAGGFKVLRLVILFRALQLMLRRVAMPPHAVIPLSLGDQKLSVDDINRALLVILLFIGVVFISWLPFVLAGYAPLDALFEVVSACGTVGLSTGITRPELSAPLKGILCFDMLAGRMEIIALLVVLYPRNWFGRRETV
jgi:trk system potassium uptake protein